MWPLKSVFNNNGNKHDFVGTGLSLCAFGKTSPASLNRFHRICFHITMTSKWPRWCLVSNRQRFGCLLNMLNHLFRRRSKKISKLNVTGLYEGNSPVTGEFPSEKASHAENVSIWWRHHEEIDFTLTNTVFIWFRDVYIVTSRSFRLVLSHPPGQMAMISQTTFWYAFSWMKSLVSRFKFHWSSFLRAQLTIIHHWYR